MVRVAMARYPTPGKNRAPPMDYATPTMAWDQNVRERTATILRRCDTDGTALSQSAVANFLFSLTFCFPFYVKKMGV